MRSPVSRPRHHSFRAVDQDLRRIVQRTLEHQRPAVLESWRFALYDWCVVDVFHILSPQWFLYWFCCSDEVLIAFEASRQAQLGLLSPPDRARKLLRKRFGSPSGRRPSISWWVRSQIGTALANNVIPNVDINILYAPMRLMQRARSARGLSRVRPQFALSPEVRHLVMRSLGPAVAKILKWVLAKDMRTAHPPWAVFAGMAGVHCESQIFRDQCCFVAQLPDCRQTGIRNSVTSAFDAIRSQEAPVANARRSYSSEFVLPGSPYSLPEHFNGLL